MCGPDQFAVCRVEDGCVYSECHNVPIAITEAISLWYQGYYPERVLLQAMLALWVQNVVTRGLPGLLSYSTEGGQFVSDGNRLIVTFRFPRFWDDIILPEHPPRGTDAG